MIIGSHNSASYAKPAHWWMRPFVFVARCQKDNIYTQYHDHNVRYFDIRVSFDKNNNIGLYHGYLKWKLSVYDVLGTLDYLSWVHKEKIYARIILEQNFHKKNQDKLDEAFKSFCKTLKMRYKNLTFVGGRRKYDWELLHNFRTKEPTVEDQYSSTTTPIPGTGRWSLIAKIDDWWPWLYARLHNKRAYAEGTDKDVLLLDFVNIGHDETR